MQGATGWGAGDGVGERVFLIRMFVSVVRGGGKRESLFIKIGVQKRDPKPEGKEHASTQHPQRGLCWGARRSVPGVLPQLHLRGRALESASARLTGGWAGWNGTFSKDFDALANNEQSLSQKAHLSQTHSELPCQRNWATFTLLS